VAYVGSSSGTLGVPVEQLGGQAASITYMVTFFYSRLIFASLISPRL
jgi:hypothetical protein